MLVPCPCDKIYDIEIMPRRLGQSLILIILKILPRTNDKKNKKEIEISKKKCIS